MNLEKENIVKFIDAMIAENYSGAHKFLEVVIQEKVKAKIKKAAKKKVFGGTPEEKKAAKKSAFGGKFPKAEDKNKKTKSNSK